LGKISRSGWTRSSRNKKAQDGGNRTLGKTQTGKVSIMEANKKVKRVASLYVQGLRMYILLGQSDEAQAIRRVKASLERHGWLQGVEPRALVRVGGAA